MVYTFTPCTFRFCQKLAFVIATNANFTMQKDDETTAPSIHSIFGIKKYN